MPGVNVQVRAAQGLKAMVAKSIRMTKSYKGGETGKSQASHNLGKNSVLANLSKATHFEFTEKQLPQQTNAQTTPTQPQPQAPLSADFTSQLSAVISSMVGEKHASLFSAAFHLSDSSDGNSLRKKRRAYRTRVSWEVKKPLLSY